MALQSSAVNAFQSPFKSEVYFVNTNRFTNLKWGTKNPIMLRDPEFGPTRIRAFGTYSIKVADPALFMTEIVGTDGEFTMDEISFQIRNIIVQEFSKDIAASGIPVLDMAANTGEVSELIRKAIDPVIHQYGLELAELYDPEAANSEDSAYAAHVRQNMPTWEAELNGRMRQVMDEVEAEGGTKQG